MKLRPGTIGAATVVVVMSAAFVWMTQRTPLETATINLGVPDTQSAAETTSTDTEHKDAAAQDTGQTEGQTEAASTTPVEPVDMQNSPAVSPTAEKAANTEHQTPADTASTDTAVAAPLSDQTADAKHETQPAAPVEQPASMSNTPSVTEDSDKNTPDAPESSTDTQTEQPTEQPESAPLFPDPTSPDIPSTPDEPVMREPATATRNNEINNATTANSGSPENSTTRAPAGNYEIPADIQFDPGAFPAGQAPTTNP